MLAVWYYDMVLPEDYPGVMMDKEKKRMLLEQQLNQLDDEEEPEPSDPPLPPPHYWAKKIHTLVEKNEAMLYDEKRKSFLTMIVSFATLALVGIILLWITFG